MLNSCYLTTVLKSANTFSVFSGHSKRDCMVTKIEKIKDSQIFYNYFWFHSERKVKIKKVVFPIY
uniref:Uncharacterized protein n=1 Tax=Octopus bimaculoides TaxID=37653 RepID=A0A0L8HEF4_OCTBM